MEKRRKYFHIMDLDDSKPVGILCNYRYESRLAELTNELYGVGIRPDWFDEFNDDMAARFYAKIGAEDALTGCIYWTAAHDANGYGQFRVGDHTRMAHQIAVLEIGLYPPDDLQRHEVHHLCENHGCVNPYHCEWLTSTEHKDRHRELNFIRMNLHETLQLFEL